MNAAFMLNSTILVGEVPDPVPAEGQALVRTLSCGLCASDVHLLHSGPAAVATSQKYGGPYSDLDLGRVIVPGHEYVGEIVDYGPGSQRPLSTGTRVTSAPIVRHGAGRSIVGQSHDCPAGFGEYMVLDESILMKIPDAMTDEQGAMIEPLAVGLEHARAGEPGPNDLALVIGCGAIGLGVIAGLRLMGRRPIVAADFDAHRRDIAIAMGADVAIDPRETSPYDPISELGGRQPNLIYECVGTRGLINSLIGSVGYGARIVIGGFCMEPEELYVPAAQMRRLKINFASGEEQQDLDLALQSIADGRIDISAWLGGQVGLGGVASALEAMTDPSSPVRTVVDPRRP